MEIISIKALHGPNIFHTKPVLTMRVQLGEYSETSSADLTGFNERLVSLLPGLIEHNCSPGRRGGFIERLERGTYPAHIIEHIALEMSELAGIGVHYGKSVYDGEPGRYKIVVSFRNEAAMKYLLEQAFACYLALARGENFDLSGAVDEAKELVLDTNLGPSGQALLDAAKARGIPYRRMNVGSLLELGFGKKRRRVQAAVSDRTNLIATELVQDKEATKTILRESFVPVPNGSVASDEDQLRATLSRMNPPWAIKPLDGHHGQGVSLDLVKVEDAIRAFYEAQMYGKEVIIEEMRQGRDYRLLVVSGRLIAAAERTPAHILGDGVHTVRQLVDKENEDPRRGVGHSKILTLLPTDDLTLEFLEAQGVSWDSIPPVSAKILLRRTGNLSTGGTAKDVTSTVHPQIRELAERVAAVVDLDICGIDLIHSDISKPIDIETAVIEVNAGPGLRMHLSPTSGQAQDVAGAIIESLFPKGDNGRIPLISVTGTNGKTTVTRVIAHTLAQSGLCVGYTTSNGIHIGGRLIVKGDTTGPISAQAVLSDPRVEAAVLETARGGIMRGGLAYDVADVAVITNIRPDHLGQDGIECIEDIVHVKSLIAEQVRDGGTLVLNADDLEAAKLVHRKAVRADQKKICFYSVSDKNPILMQQMMKDPNVAHYFVRNGWLIEAHGSTETKIIPADQVSFSFNGTSDYQISNALACVAAARATGVSLESVRLALKTFEPQTQNLGRGNLYKIGEGHLLLDYGHNPDAIAAVARTVHKWNPARVIGVLGLPGDRADELLKESAAQAAKSFDRLILRDDHDRRGRALGEVPLLAMAAAEHANPHCEISVILNEEQAIAHTIESLKKGDVAVMFYDELDKTLEVLRRYDPQPVLEVPIELNSYERDITHAITSAAHSYAP